MLSSINDFVVKKTGIRRGKQKDEDIAKDAVEVERSIKMLQDEMENALLSDHESNKNKKPAFKRLLLLNKIENTLRKTN